MSLDHPKLPDFWTPKFQIEGQTSGSFSSQNSFSYYNPSWKVFNIIVSFSFYFIIKYAMKNLSAENRGPAHLQSLTIAQIVMYNPCHFSILKIAEESSFADEVSQSFRFKILSTSILDDVCRTGWQYGWWACRALRQLQLSPHWYQLFNPAVAHVFLALHRKSVWYSFS